MNHEYLKRAREVMAQCPYLLHVDVYYEALSHYCTLRETEPHKAVIVPELLARNLGVLGFVMYHAQRDRAARWPDAVDLGVGVDCHARALRTGPLAQFDDVTRKVTEERGAVYGHPSDDFAKVDKIKEAVAGCPDPIVRHGLEMIGVKLARLAATPDHLDSVIDIAGYARTIAMHLDRQVAA